MRTTVSIKGHPPLDLDLDDIALHEALALEDATGYAVADLGRQLQSGRMSALAAVLWLLLKFRIGEEVSYADITSGAYPLSLKNDIVIDIEEDGGQEGEAVPTGGGSGETPSP